MSRIGTHSELRLVPGIQYRLHSFCFTNFDLPQCFTVDELEYFSEWHGR